MPTGEPKPEPQPSGEGACVVCGGVGTFDDENHGASPCVCKPRGEHGPWRLDGDGYPQGNRKMLRVVDSFGTVIAHVHWDEDAAFIVKRCNAPEPSSSVACRWCKTPTSRHDAEGRAKCDRCDARHTIECDSCGRPTGGHDSVRCMACCEKEPSASVARSETVLATFLDNGTMWELVKRKGVP